MTLSDMESAFEKCEKSFLACLLLVAPLVPASAQGI